MTFFVNQDHKTGKKSISFLQSWIIQTLQYHGINVQINNINSYGGKRLHAMAEFFLNQAHVMTYNLTTRLTDKKYWNFI
jgi:hypothetical protein